ncbi:MAG: TetR/AcrR family transcriptional regulator [Henriciella sp.]|nr:TetR/AcrR family transcriptional regulator [Henriciella sp.]MBO6696843.1 TetR/AcrR family transcriptional regulator [Henriciella sp.]
MQNQRRIPAQERAKFTHDTILTAAAHILEHDGEELFTTNRVAEKAGVSIGSLYQYFQHKQAILVALAVREEQKLESGDELKNRASVEKRSPLRLGIRNYIRMLPDTPLARAKALETMLTTRGHEGVARETKRRFEESGLFVGLSQSERFVLSRAITGVVQSAVRERNADLTSQSFEDALVNLVRGFLRARRAS